MAADGVQIRVWSGGQQWLVSWHPPPDPPDGTPHGAEGVCVTIDGDIVVISPLLGFTRGQCVAGPERGRVLVRSVWRADVELRPGEARFEIAERRLVAAAAVEDALSLGANPFAPFIRRELREAAR